VLKTDGDEIPWGPAQTSDTACRGVCFPGPHGFGGTRTILLEIDLRLFRTSQYIKSELFQFHVPGETKTNHKVALLAGTRFPSPLEPLFDTLLKHFGKQLLRATILSAGSEGPRSVIPNLAELLASFVQRVPGEEMMRWMAEVLGEEGFPDVRATGAAKARLKEVVMK